MDPEKALELVKKGATLLLLDVPQHTVIGIDTQVYSVGPAFKGLKMIPPGSHFVYYSSASRDGKEFSPVIGFFVDVGSSEVILRKWEPQEERLVRVSEEENERYSEAVKSLEFDRQLGSYNISQYGDWNRLSNFVTKDVIERLEPIGGEITVSRESEMAKTPEEKAKEEVLDKQLKTSKFSTTQVDGAQRRGCYYTPIPHLIKRRGIQGQELTSLNLDKTLLLETLLQNDYGGSESSLLGELQFSFIAFMMGQSLEGFFQWKSLVSLLFGCVDAVYSTSHSALHSVILNTAFRKFRPSFANKNPLPNRNLRPRSRNMKPFHTRAQLFVKFIKVIYYQLKLGLRKDCSYEGGGGPALIDDSWLSGDSFLHHLCKDFFSLIQESSVVDGDLLSWTRKFQKLLENRLGWDFNQNGSIDVEENDEYAPVVEMLDDPELA